MWHAPGDITTIEMLGDLAGHQEHTEDLKPLKVSILEKRHIMIYQVISHMKATYEASINLPKNGGLIASMGRLGMDGGQNSVEFELVTAVGLVVIYNYFLKDVH